MKYFLAVDKGSFYSNKERFKRIKLSLLNESLASDNNLEALCTFTSTFSTVSQLKAFLIAQKLLEPRLSIHDLTMVYFKDFDRSMDIVYAIDANYFDLEYLKQAIYSQALKPVFIKSLMEKYYKNKLVLEEIKALRVFYSNMYPDSRILYRVISSLVDKLCLKNEINDKNYLALYELAMFVSRACNPNRDVIIHEQEKKNDIKIEGEKDREEEQIRWF